MSKITSNYFEHEGLCLHYLSAGQGPLVIFYHGFPLFSFSFHHQMNALADRYRVVAIDGPGINLSDKPSDLAAYRLPALVLPSWTRLGRRPCFRIRTRPTSTFVQNGFY
jgi:pimeloyl-ACP methyl ester carboxylesterase